jgi:hypothetical protein
VKVPFVLKTIFTFTLIFSHISPLGLEIHLFSGQVTDTHPLTCCSMEEIQKLFTVNTKQITREQRDPSGSMDHVMSHLFNSSRMIYINRYILPRRKEQEMAEVFKSSQFKFPAKNFESMSFK